MQPAILERIQRDGPLHLSLLGGGRGRGALAAFRGQDSYPVWIAKSATDELLMSRMRREHEALVYLEPWAAQLGVPRILHWESHPDGCHMIRSGVPGEADIFATPVSATRKEMEQRFAKPLAWLRRFQTMVPPPRQFDTAQLLASQIEELHTECPGEVAQGLAQALQAMAPDTAMGVVTHGDFFPLNILHCRQGLHVVDWDAFGCHMPMRDYIYLFFGAEYYAPGHSLAMDENATALLFTPRLEACQYVVGELRNSGFSENQQRFYFYCYVAHMLSQHPRERHVWRRFYEKAAGQGFPAPGTEMRR